MRGTCDALTIDSVWASVVVLVIVTVPPERTVTVPATKRKVFVMTTFGLNDSSPLMTIFAFAGPLPP